MTRRVLLVLVAAIVVAAAPACRKHAPPPVPAVADATAADDAGAAAAPDGSRDVAGDAGAPGTRIVTRVVDGQVVVVEETIGADAGAAVSGGAALPAGSDGGAPASIDGGAPASIDGGAPGPIDGGAPNDAGARDAGPLGADARPTTPAQEADALVERAGALAPGAEQRALLAAAYELAPTARIAARVGDAADADNDATAAIEAYQRALRIEPRNTGMQAKLARLQAAAAVDAKFATVKSRRFILRFDGDPATGTAKDVLAELEREMDDVVRATGVEPPGPVTVLFYLKGGFEAASGSPHWAGGVFDGKIRVRSAAQFTAGRNELLEHELVHAVLAMGVGGRFPAWFNEGLAERVARPPGSRVELLRPHLTTLRPTLAQMANGADAARLPSVALYYAASQDIVDVLHEARGDAGIQDLLGRMKGGAGFSAALRETYGLDENGLRDRWLARYPKPR